MIKISELIRVEKANKIFFTNKFLKKEEPVHAVNQVDLTIYQGETLGLVGESGSGKTTLGRSILQLEILNSGAIFFKGVNLTQASLKEKRALQKKMQIIYQDPYSSLNPNLSALQIVMEPLSLQFSLKEAQKQALAMLKLVGISGSEVDKLPKAFSGGQRQRIGIARGVANQPEFILCDEVISALDVSMQAQIIQLLMDLQKQFGLTYLFISHDLAAVRSISDRIVVMYQGKIVEMAPTEELFQQPQHEYTKNLLAAMLTPDPKKARQQFQTIQEPYVRTATNTEWLEVSKGHFYAKDKLK